MMLLQLDAQPPGQQAGADVNSKLSEMVRMGPQWRQGASGDGLGEQVHS